MPELSDHMAYGPGSAMPGPVVGALVPFVLGPLDFAAAAVSAGANTIGFYAPCDLRIESVSWAAHVYMTGTNTVAIYKHTDVLGGEGGTAIKTATAITAAGRVEGASFASSAARNVTKGQCVALDLVLSGTGTYEDLCFVVMAYITGHAVADVAAR